MKEQLGGEIALVEGFVHLRQYDHGELQTFALVYAHYAYSVVVQLAGKVEIRAFFAFQSVQIFYQLEKTGAFVRERIELFKEFLKQSETARAAGQECVVVRLGPQSGDEASCGHSVRHEPPSVQPLAEGGYFIFERGGL